MKINNKYSRRRWNFRMKLKILHMRFLKYLYKIFPKINFLENIDYDLYKKDYDFSDINLNLEHIEVFEIVLNEDLNVSISSIVKMIEKNKPRQYMIPNDSRRVKEKLHEIVSSSSSKGWSNLGYVHFERNKLLDEYVKYIELSLITISGSFSVISMDIFLNESMISEFEDNILNNISPLAYKGIIRSFEFFKLKRIALGGRISSEKTKNILIEDIITQLKTECVDEVSNFIKLYFKENDVCAPSLNAYSTNINHYETTDTIRHIWRSLNIKNHYGELRKDGAWAIFMNDERDSDKIRFNNYSIVFRDEYKEKYHENYRSYIDFNMHLIGYQYFFILVYRTFIQFYENAFTRNSNIFYERLKRKNINLSEWIKLKMKFDEIDFMFNRMYETVKDDHYKFLIKEEESNYVEFNSRFHRGNILGSYWKNIIEFYDEMEINRIRLMNDINMYISSITSISNLKYNNKSIRIMIITAIISLLSVLVALFSVLIATGSI